MKANIGDIIKLGHYPQSDPYGRSEEPIEWLVLDVDDSKALVISVKALDMVKYNETYTETNWAECTLRKWLNGTFPEKAFSAEEKALIVPVTLKNPGNEAYGTPGCEDTEDGVFAFSVEEVKKYFPDKESRKAEPTAYAQQQGAYVYAENGKACWWLRTPGFSRFIGSRVNVGGGISDLIYDDARAHRAARPVMWIKVD